MALCTRFDPQPMGVRLFSDAKRDEAYFHARPYLLEQLRILLEQGWKRNEYNDRNSEYCYNQTLFVIYKPTKAKKGSQPRREKKLILPLEFASFLDISKANTWRTIFENPEIFKAGKKGKKNLDLFIQSSPPLSNIFYLLQVLAPGMLIIYHEYQLQNADVKVSRVLPRASWIKSNLEVMSKTDALLAAANDREIAFHEERTARPQNSPHHNPLSASGSGALPSTAKDQKIPSQKKKRTRRPRNNSHHDSLAEYTIIPGYLNKDEMDQGCDWAVCDKDCGWCGRCRFF